MRKDIETLLTVIHKQLVTKSVIESHCIDYDEETDYFVLHVVLDGVLHSRKIKGFDGDYITSSTAVDRVDALAKTLIDNSNTELLEIIYSN